jgi:hypothetical protein
LRLDPRSAQLAIGIIATTWRRAKEVPVSSPIEASDTSSSCLIGSIRIASIWRSMMFSIMTSESTKST